MILSNSCVLNERYTIQSVLGEVGPFDVNYLAWDLKDEKEIVVREYYPLQLTKRAADGMLLEVHNADLFEYGLGAYSAEGLLLSKLEHAYVAGCKDQFKQNGTVYSVHNFVSGASLGAHLKQQKGKLTEEEALPIIEKVLLALQASHERKLYHGGVSPRTILIDANGEPLLHGFQAARFRLARECDSLPEIIKPGYSAPEQTTCESEEGPWWDIYGAAATLFHMLTGQELPAASDGWSSSKIKVALYRDALLSSEMCDVLAVALAFEEADRPESVVAFLDMLMQTQKVVHQLHEGDGVPQFEVGYGPEVTPHEAVWQNGLDVTAAKVKIEKEVPAPAPHVEENELVESEMPNVVPSPPSQMISATPAPEVLPPHEPEPQRSSGREQELEVLLTKMVKWQQVFVAFILGIVVLALLGLVGGVFFGQGLFQSSGNQPATAQVEASGPAAALAAAGALPEGEEPANEEVVLPQEPGLANEATLVNEGADSVVESDESTVIQQPTREDVLRAQQQAESSLAQALQVPAPVEETPANDPPPAQVNTTPAQPVATPAPEQPETQVEESVVTESNEGVFFTDEELGVSIEEPEDLSGTRPNAGVNEQESLFNYYRVQGDSLMNQGFRVAALQWYRNALKYNADDTYINEQIQVITTSINNEEQAIRASDSLQARLEQVRDQNGIFLLPDTPVLVRNEAELRSQITYPIAALEGGISGRVILRYMVDEQGRLQDIKVVKGLKWGLDEVVMDLLRNAAFTPATFNGEPVKAWATFSTVFRIDN
ncbi:MAG: TonB family protein [Bacteroidota bacterium]